MKLLTGGGLGDAAMAVAKLYAKFNPSDIKLTHVEVHQHLLSPIGDFYMSQGIDAEVKWIPSWRWKNEHESEYDFWLDSGWQDGWPILPFPPLKFDLRTIDILVNPISGRNGNRSLSKAEIELLDSKRITYVGTRGNLEGLLGTSLIGKTSIKDLVDLICSANVIITPEGFVAYLGAMAGKKVWVKRDNLRAIERRKHPDWELFVFDKIDQVAQSLS